MVDVIRMFSDGRGHPATLRCPRIVSPGILDWAVLPWTMDAALLVTASEFGDLRLFASLSAASRPWRRCLAKSMGCLREWVQNHDFRLYTNSCWYCGSLGLSRGFVSECPLCDTVTCEDCVLVGVSDLLRRPRKVRRRLVSDDRTRSWLCAGCGEEENVVYVESLKHWFIEIAVDRVYRVASDYDFSFYVRLVALSGDVVVDEQRKPLRLLSSTWSRRLQRVWEEVRGMTGWRLTHMVTGQVAVNEAANDRWRWSDFLTRSEARGCTEQSPFVVRLILKDFG